MKAKELQKPYMAFLSGCMWYLHIRCEPKHPSPRLRLRHIYGQATALRPPLTLEQW